MNLCQCGAQATYPHDPFCPYPLYRCTDLQWHTWEESYRAKRDAWARNVHPLKCWSCGLDEFGSRAYVGAPYHCGICGRAPNEQVDAYIEREKQKTTG